MSNTTLPFIIGVSGSGAGSGKDTFADYLMDKMEQQSKTAVKYSFAYPLKEIAKFVFGFTDEEVYDPIKKEETDERVYGMTRRKAMQLLGTESFRDIFASNIWIDVARRMLREMGEGTDSAIIPDVRFQNEASFIKLNGILIYVDSDSRQGYEKTQESQHASEKGFDEEPDIVVYNTGTLEDLEKKANFVYDHYLRVVFDSLKSIDEDMKQHQRQIVEDYSNMAAEAKQEVIANVSDKLFSSKKVEL